MSDLQPSPKAKASAKGQPKVSAKTQPKHAPQKVIDPEHDLNTPAHLCWLSHRGETEKVLAYLTKRPKDLNVKSNSPTCQRTYWYTPLGYALDGLHFETARALIKKGGLLWANNCGGGVLWVLLSPEITKKNVHEKEDEVLKFFKEIIKKNTDLSKSNVDGVTPLHVAAKKGSLKIVKLLLSKGADPLIRDTSGKLPIDMTENKEIKETILKVQKIEEIKFEEYKKQQQATPPQIMISAMPDCSIANEIGKHLGILGFTNVITHGSNHGETVLVARSAKIFLPLINKNWANTHEKVFEANIAVRCELVYGTPISLPLLIDENEFSISETEKNIEKYASIHGLLCQQTPICYKGDVKKLSQEIASRLKSLGVKSTNYESANIVGKEIDLEDHEDAEDSNIEDTGDDGDVGDVGDSSGDKDTENNVESENSDTNETRTESKLDNKETKNEVQTHTRQEKKEEKEEEEEYWFITKEEEKEIRRLYPSSLKMVLKPKTDENWGNNLRFCARNGVLKQLQRVLSIRGTKDLESVNKFNETALVLACKYGHQDCAATLIRAGANIEHLANGGTPLIWACRCFSPEFFSKREPQLVGLVLYLLSFHKVNVNKRNQIGETALHAAVQRASVAMIKVLLAFGAKKDIKTIKGHLPIQYSSSKSVKNILEGGEDPKELIKNKPDVVIGLYESDLKIGEGIKKVIENKGYRVLLSNIQNESDKMISLALGKIYMPLINFEWVSNVSCYNEFLTVLQNSTSLYTPRIIPVILNCNSWNAWKKIETEYQELYGLLCSTNALVHSVEDGNLSPLIEDSVNSVKSYLGLEHKQQSIQVKSFESNQLIGQDVMISLNCRTMLKTALKIQEFLRTHGYSVWMCSETLVGGDDFRDEIVKAANSCRIFIPLINELWAKSGECVYETKVALSANSRHGFPKFIAVFPDPDFPLSEVVEPSQKYPTSQRVLHLSSKQHTLLIDHKEELLFLNSILENVKLILPK